MLTDNGNEFRGATSPAPWRSSVPATAASTPADHRPTANVEALHKTILDECWRPAFARYLYPRYSGLDASSTPT